ncbi:hypothetical protein PGTUg99_032746 [Puccinia graminis f. sp. tritici]|uniref:Uncharacterized protein n=1 Tax=Puccinia graminis f. sp. tritici TaxID=56615 RepID=A0A5B0SEG3_PUCGR|nr:hypothetical protein PGTUg99_032746 [Puccinia graminis f. sp. tritici]
MGIQTRIRSRQRVSSDTRPLRSRQGTGWKGFLPVGEVHVPRRLEETLPVGSGEVYAPARCMYLSPAGRKPFKFQPAIGLGYPLRYPGICWKISGKGISAPEPASAGGYPLQRAGIRQRIRITGIRQRIRITGIRQRITGIRDGYPETISTPYCSTPHLHPSIHINIQSFNFNPTMQIHDQ